MVDWTGHGSLSPKAKQQRKEKANAFNNRPGENSRDRTAAKRVQSAKAKTPAPGKKR